MLSDEVKKDHAEKYLRQAFLHTFFAALGYTIPSLVSGEHFVLWRFALGWLIIAVSLSALSCYRCRQEVKTGTYF